MLIPAPDMKIVSPIINTVNLRSLESPACVPLADPSCATNENPTSALNKSSEDASNENKHFESPICIPPADLSCATHERLSGASRKDSENPSEKNIPCKSPICASPTHLSCAAHESLVSALSKGSENSLNEDETFVKSDNGTFSSSMVPSISNKPNLRQYPSASERRRNKLKRSFETQLTPIESPNHLIPTGEMQKLQNSLTVVETSNDIIGVKIEDLYSATSLGEVDISCESLKLEITFDTSVKSEDLTGNSSESFIPAHEEESMNPNAHSNPTPTSIEKPLQPSSLDPLVEPLGSPSLLPVETLTPVAVERVPETKAVDSDVSSVQDPSCLKIVIDVEKDDIHEMLPLTNSMLLGTRKEIIRRYVCPLCNASFAFNQRYKKHLEKHKEMYACTVCNKVFKNERSYRRHALTKIHVKNALEVSKPIIIDDDNLSSENRQPAKRKRYRGPKRVFNCTLCDKVFHHPVLLESHTNSHLGIKPEICSECGKQFASQRLLKSHNKRIHTKIKPYICDICKKSFTHRTILVSHLKLHSGLKDHVCPECGKRYTTKAHLNLHLLYHSNLLNYLCMYCGKQYRTKREVELHEMKKHGDVHECSRCDLTFTYRSSLIKHNWSDHLERESEGSTSKECSSSSKSKEKFHRSISGKSVSKLTKLKGYKQTGSNERPYSCIICKRSFKHKCQLNTHIICVHRVCRSGSKVFRPGSKVFNCIICRKEFASQNSLRNHLDWHEGVRPYPCKLCGKRFTQKSHLATHLKVHQGLKPFTCSVCNKTFSTRGNLGQHVAVHEEAIKRFKCDVCKKNFLFKSRLLKHMESHNFKVDNQTGGQVVSDSPVELG